MIKSLETWFAEHKAKMQTKGISLSFWENKIRKPVSNSATLDLESTELIGDIIVWNTGACDINVIKNAESYENCISRMPPTDDGTRTV